jgi:hypothetical protein
LLLVTFLSRLPAYDESDIEELKKLPWLSPESCSHAEPYSFWEECADNEARRNEMGGSSEQNQDVFFHAYAGNLAFFTDKRYPLARKIREPLHSAFGRLFFFIGSTNDLTGTKHFADRLPASLEWDIYSGFNNHFPLDPDRRFSVADIRRIAHQLQLAYPENKLNSNRSLIYNFEPDLKDLEKAEGPLSVDAIYYFREKIMTMFEDYLAQEREHH